MADVVEQALRALKAMADCSAGVSIARLDYGRGDYVVRCTPSGMPPVEGRASKLIGAIIACHSLAADRGGACEACGQVVLDDGKACIEHRER